MKTIREIYNEILSEKINVSPKDRTNVNKATLKKGAKVEHEHTSSQNKAETIAIQHMKEFGKKDKDGNLNSDYYKELDNMERKLKKKLNEGMNLKRLFNIHVIYKSDGNNIIKGKVKAYSEKQARAYYIKIHPEYRDERLFEVYAEVDMPTSRLPYTDN